MSGISRVGVSLETDLLREFDDLIVHKGFASRSDAVREMIHSALSERRLSRRAARAVAGIFLIYDHHAPGLGARLTRMQHSRFYQVLACTHIHLDRHNCLEAIILRGKAAEIQDLADQLSSVKGVRFSRVSLFGVGGGGGHHHPHD